MYRVLLYVLAVGATLVGLIIGAQNAAKVQLDLLFWQLQWPLGVLIVLAFVSGILMGLLAIYVFRVIPLKLALRRAAKAKQPAPRGDAGSG